MNILKRMRWIGSGNICGRDEKWTNILTRKSDDKRNFGTNICRWDVIIALDMDVKVWTGLILTEYVALLDCYERCNGTRYSLKAGHLLFG